MGTRPPSVQSILVALAFALSVFGFTLFVWLSFGGAIPLKPKGYTVHIIFGPEAAQLTPGAQARISGVPVGKVIGVTHSTNGTNAEIQLERPYAPLQADARAIVRLKTLLGETFIDIAPGSKEGPAVPDGGTLARSQVEPVQAVDEVLGAFDAPTRQALQVFLRDVSASLDGRGEDVNAALGNLPATTEGLTELVDLLNRQEPAVRGLVSNGAIALDAIASRDDELQSLIREGNSLLTATAERNRSITAAVRALPPFLRDLRITVVDLQKTTDVAAPTLHELRPVAPLVRPALEGTLTLAPQVERLFREVGPVIPAARRGITSLTRIVEAAAPLVDVLHQAVPNLMSVVKLLNEYRQDGIATLAKLGAATNGVIERSDGSRVNYLRSIIPFTNEVLVGYTERPGTNRHQPYFRPGGLARINDNGYQAFDCENLGNPTPIPVIGTGGPPDCLFQHPWRFQDRPLSFPHPEVYGYPDEENN
jgi:phospholipid/cholesterol/gamma-HCH transport system substrate-binding protein